MLEPVALVLAHLLIEPKHGYIRATVQDELAPDYPAFEVEANQWTTDWVTQDGAFQFAWDSARQLSWAGNEARTMPKATHWTLPAESAVRLVLPRLLPIWGRPADKHWPSRAHWVNDHLVELDLLSEDYPVSRVVLDVEEQVALEAEFLGTHLRVLPGSLQRSDKPTWPIPHPDEPGRVVLPSVTRS